MKKKGQGGTGHNLVRQDAVPERANPTVPLRSLNIFKNALSKTKHQKKKDQGGTGHTRTQNATVPGRGKIHRAPTILENL